jgi:hypothetical protein
MTRLAPARFAEPRGSGPVQLLPTQGLSRNRANRARAGRRGLGSVREQPGQRAKRLYNRGPWPAWPGLRPGRSEGPAGGPGEPGARV